jgi:hypothetical protein
VVYQLDDGWLRNHDCIDNLYTDARLYGIRRLCVRAFLCFPSEILLLGRKCIFHETYYGTRRHLVGASPRRPRLILVIRHPLPYFLSTSLVVSYYMSSTTIADRNLPAHIEPSE